MIMFQGKILAADTPENLLKLMSSNSQVIAEIAAPVAALQECFAQMSEIAHADISAGNDDYCRCALTPQNGLDLRPRIFEVVRQRGWALRELTRNRHSLEDIYVQVTHPDEEER